MNDKFNNMISNFLLEGDKVAGGLADRHTIFSLAKLHDVPVLTIRKQLIKGTKVEMEHTDDPVVAREIAMDHIAEFHDYYDRLDKIED